MSQLCDFRRMRPFGSVFALLWIGLRSPRQNAPAVVGLIGYGLQMSGEFRNVQVVRSLA